MCKDCIVGKSSSERSAVCRECAKGQFQNQTKMPLCKDCEVNTFTNQIGQSSCKTCGIGEKAVDEGSAKCIKCDAGEAGTGTNGICEPCGVGKYRPSTINGVDTDLKKCK